MSDILKHLSSNYHMHLHLTLLKTLHEKRYVSHLDEINPPHTRLFTCPETEKTEVDIPWLSDKVVRCSKGQKKASGKIEAYDLLNVNFRVTHSVACILRWIRNPSIIKLTASRCNQKM